MSESPPTLRVETTETSPILRTLEVEIDADRVRKAYDRAYRDLAKGARIKGFRPGKAPRSVLERVYGASLAEDIERQLVGETLHEAVEQSGVEPVAEPAVESNAPTPGEPFRYVARVEVRPPIELPTLVGLPATRPSVVVEDEEVEGELASLQERRATTVDAEEGTAAENGSVLVVDYVGRIDGEAFEGGTSEGATIELGSGRLVPGFEDQLLGAVAGEERQVSITFPDDYPSEDVKGKDAVFDVKVVGVKRREKPALDDEFAKSLGDEFESLDALRERIRKDLVDGRERQAKSEARRTLMDALIERTEFDAPPGMVDRRLHQRLSMAYEQLKGGMGEAELEAQVRQWREQWRPDAEREVRESLLLEAVAEDQQLEVSDESLDARVEEMAAEQGMAAARLRQSYEERGLIEALRSQMREESALEFLLDGAKVEETTAT